jgi:hypothetical protein
MNEIALFFVYSIGLAAIICVFAYAAEQMQRRGRAIGRPERVRLQAPGSYSQAFQQSLDILTIVDARILDADPNRGTILAATGLSVASLGSTVTVKLETLEFVTYVTLEARPTINYFDWGHAKRLVKDFEEAWRVQCIPQMGETPTS